MAAISTIEAERAGRCEMACASALAASFPSTLNEKKQGSVGHHSNGARAFGFSHSLRLAGFLPLLSRSRASFAPSGVPGALSVTFGGTSRRGSQSFRDQPLNQFAVSVIHVFNALSKLSLRPDHHGRSNREWRYPISVMRCPK